MRDVLQAQYYERVQHQGLIYEKWSQREGRSGSKKDPVLPLEYENFLTKIPSSIEVYLSKDAESWEKMDGGITENPERKLEVCTYSTASFDRKARYIKLMIQHEQPEGREKGNAFMVDEIIVK